MFICRIIWFKYVFPRRTKLLLFIISCLYIGLFDWNVFPRRLSCMKEVQYLFPFYHCVFRVLYNHLMDSYCIFLESHLLWTITVLKHKTRPFLSKISSPLLSSVKWRGDIKISIMDFGLLIQHRCNFVMDKDLFLYFWLQVWE